MGNWGTAALDVRATRLEPLDARGNRIRKGSRVRVVGIPDLSAMRRVRARRKLARVFRHVRGQCKAVSGFGRYGHVELLFRIRSGSLAGLHVVELEPSLLLVQKRAKSF